MADTGYGTVPPMDCVDFVRLVDELVGSDPQQWGDVVAKHLDDCPPCLVYLQQMLDLKVLLDHVFDGERLDDEHVAAVIDTLDALHKEQHR